MSLNTGSIANQFDKSIKVEKYKNNVCLNVEVHKSSTMKVLIFVIAILAGCFAQNNTNNITSNNTDYVI